MRARSRLSRSSWITGLTTLALAGSLVVAVARPAVAGGNASLQLTKTVTGATVTPTLAASLAVDSRRRYRAIN